MKILYVQPGSGIGGSKISLANMLKFADTDQRSYIVLSHPPNDLYETIISDYVEKIHYIDLPTWQKYKRNSLIEKVRAPFSHFYRLLSLFPAGIRLSKIITREKIDIIHTNNSITAVGAVAAHLSRTPHIWHIRESIGARSRYPLILGDYISSLIYKNFSDALIFNSQFCRNFFDRMSCNGVIVRNGIDITIFSNINGRGDVMRKKLFSSDHYPVIAMIGNINSSLKKHSIFLEASAKIMQDFQKCNFAVFGGNSDLNLTPYTKQLKIKAVSLGIEGKVVWVDFVDDIPAMMNSIDILIHPATEEGSGRVVMEAMAAGKPVIGVKSGGVQELIQDGVTGYLVEPDNSTEMAEKALYLLKNPEQQENIGRHAREYAVAHFSNETMMQEITKIYKKILTR